MNVNMIHTWLKDPCFAPIVEEPIENAVLLPFEIDGSTVNEPVYPEIPASPPFASRSTSRVDIILSDGRRILVESLNALAAVFSLVPGVFQFDPGSVQYARRVSRKCRVVS